MSWRQLCTLFERSWHLERFLIKGKKANVAPIFRKAEERMPGNDRLVSHSMPLGRPWSKSFWKPLPAMGKRRR